MNLWILRSNAANPDVRVEKYFRFSRCLKISVTFFGWARNGILDWEHAESLRNADLRVRLYSREAEFGQGLRNLGKLIGFQAWLFWQLFSASEPPTFVHACDFDTAAPAFFANLARKLTFRKTYRLIYDVFDYYADAFPVPRIVRPWIARLDRYIVNAADLIILPTESRTEQVGILPSDSRLIIIPNANDIPVKTIERDRNNFIRIGYSGVLTEGRFLRELVEVVLNDDRFELYVVGFGALDSFFRAAAAICNRVKYFGRLPHSDAMSLMATSDVIFGLYDPVIPNHRYASPNKFFESLQFGIPILVLNGTSVDSWVRKFSSGYVFESGSVGLVGAIIEAANMNSQQFRDRCIKNYLLYYSESSQIRVYGASLGIEF